LAAADAVEGVPKVRRRWDMNDGFLPAFLARWTRMRERYLADPNDHGVKHARLVKLWKRFGGRCDLCGGRVPHPILELDWVTEDNAPTADHAKPRVEGGRCGKNSGSPTAGATTGRGACRSIARFAGPSGTRWRGDSARSGSSREFTPGLGRARLNAARVVAPASCFLEQRDSAV
jgi:hypothetical protein